MMSVRRPLCTCCGINRYFVLALSLLFLSFLMSRFAALSTRRICSLKTAFQFDRFQFRLHGYDQHNVFASQQRFQLKSHRLR